MNQVKSRIDTDRWVVADRDVARMMRTACRDLNEIVRIMDTRQDSDMAGQLHTLIVELRQLSAQAEQRSDQRCVTQEVESAVALAH